MRVFALASSDAHQVHAGLRTARRQARDRLRTAEGDARAAFGTAGHHAGTLRGALGWWAVASFGLLSLLLGLLVALWPSLASGAAVVGAWLVFVALGRFGGAQVLRARYGGSRLLQAAAALVALASVVVVRFPEFDATVGGAAAGLALGVAAAGDAGAASRFPSLARSCLRVRAACGLIAAMAVAAAPVHGLIAAAACVGLGELMLAVRLLPEVERLAGMIGRGDPQATAEDDQWLMLPQPGPAPLP